VINAPNEGFEKEDKFSISKDRGQKIIMHVKNLSKTYYRGKTPVQALRNASITVKKENFLP
jgi:hypothetical protein